jgi:hypothetical protein
MFFHGIVHGGEGLVDLDEHIIKLLPSQSRHGFEARKMMLETLRKNNQLVDQFRNPERLLEEAWTAFVTHLTLPLFFEVNFTGEPGT